MTDWPVIVTNACADNCARELGLDRYQAVAWLEGLIRDGGRITEHLPAPVSGRRSPSGRFLVVDDILILPLAADRQGRPQWIATNCLFFPAYRSQYGVARNVDPFSLTGAALLAHVNITAHAVERFQQRCGGSPHPQIAEQQLLDALAPVVRAVAKPPAWCRTGKADFFLVAHDEFCLPVSRHGSAGRAFDALTCMHRASDLFALSGQSLAARTSFDPEFFAAEDERRLTIAAAFGPTVGLSWTRPPWVKPDPRARFWIVFSGRLAAPVAWLRDAPDRPLVILDLATRGRGRGAGTEQRTWLQRLLQWIRPKR